MESNIDDKELARLAQLSADHEMPEIIGALVAEVRRLRENLNIFIDEDQSRVILVQQQMLDCMRGKVEAFEWAWEVNDVVDDLIFSLREDAVKELQATWNAAREAVHADR